MNYHVQSLSYPVGGGVMKKSPGDSGITSKEATWYQTSMPQPYLTATTGDPKCDQQKNCSAEP